jgi:hypothetical protein
VPDGSSNTLDDHIVAVIDAGRLELNAGKRVPRITVHLKAA